MIGNKKWNKLRTEIWFLYSVTDEKQQLKTILIDEFQLHFNRGGRFYQSYALSSGCIDWCMKYQLSDTFDDEFVSLCLCHEHTRRYAVIKNRDSFFQRSLVMHTRRYHKRTLSPKLNTVVVLHVENSCICKQVLLLLRMKVRKIVAIFLGRILNFHMRK